MITAPKARFAVFTLLALSIVVTAFLFLIGERRLHAARSAAAQIETITQEYVERTVALALAELSYVLPGHDPEKQASETAAVLADLKARTTGLQAAIRAAESRSILNGMRGRLDELGKLDERVRDYLRGDQRLAATDLIATEIQEELRLLRADVNRLRAVEAGYLDSESGTERARGTWTAAAAGVIALTCGLLLVRVPSSRSRAAEEAVAQVQYEIPTPLERPERSTTPDLEETARLCTDLARVLGPGELPALLERAANILGATGLVVWLADDDAVQLRPALAHGYGPEVLPKLGVLPRTANNMTAAAFRSGELQVVAAEEGKTGALVVPILTPEGSRGVLACEIPLGTNAGATMQAVARLIAAQLATLLDMAPAAAASAEAQGRG